MRSPPEDLIARFIVDRVVRLQDVSQPVRLRPNQRPEVVSTIAIVRSDLRRSRSQSPAPGPPPEQPFGVSSYL